MQWGNDIIDWLASDEGERVLFGAIIPFLAIIVAGFIGGAIGRGSTRRVIAQYNRDALTAAVQALVLAGRKAAGWNGLSTVERVQVDHLIGEAETRIRLLPVAGASLAASWAAHQLEDMKRNSAGFSFQAQQTLAEYRDRLIAWSEKPRSAKKLFGADIDRWKYETDADEQALLAEQARWESSRTSERESAAVGGPSAAPAAAPAIVPAASPASATPAPASAPAVMGGSAAASPAEATPTQAYVVPPRQSDDEAGTEAPRPVAASDVRDRVAPFDSDEHR
ncbi:hypothetical protein OVN20_07900 [Microcella daejeonensis]|uniref:hypothetical protein n=1 Tax=Microcella daejeonensis TaxID=2994971 RepID=UPI00226ED813|nr:hypothetical protein [Microcella daejeonensis]WAB83029.1 hypothetical protein OVN20_07900 [Microcella daejeonensis]